MPYQNPYLPPQMGNQYAQYQPQGYMPAIGTPMQQQQQQQPVHGFVYVTGLDGAKAYQMPPNSEMPLFDSSGDIMYIKTTDGAGFPTIKVCDVSERQAAQAIVSSEYVTHDELERVYADISKQMEQMKGAVYGAISTGADAAVAAGEPHIANAKHSSNDGR